MRLQGKRIAILIAEGFEDLEFWVSLMRLQEEGSAVTVVGVKAGEKLHGKNGLEGASDVAADAVKPDDFDALVIPGGYSPDKLRMDIDMVRLVRTMFTSGKPVAAVCHGPWMLVEADALDGRTVTSWPSLKTDLINAGARWVDRPVVEDENVITSRNPGDLEAFSRAVLQRLAPERRAATGDEARPGA